MTDLVIFLENKYVNMSDSGGKNVRSIKSEKNLAVPIADYQP